MKILFRVYEILIIDKILTQIAANSLQKVTTDLMAPKTMNINYIV